MIPQYTALALQPTMRGCQKRSEIAGNLKHISELIDAAVWIARIDAPVRLITIPEGSLQGFTDEIFDWEQERYVEELAVDVPGEETEVLGLKARQHNAYIIAQAKVKDPDFPKRYFNCAFIIDPQGKVIHKHYKLHVCTPVEGSTVPHDVWDRWVELHGENLDAFYQVTETEIGRIGTLICYEGTYPETSRGLAINGAEIIYRSSYAEPWVSNGIWELQNRAHAFFNTCYFVAPNVATYYVTQDCAAPIDVFGGRSMIVDYTGRVIANHDYGSGSSYAAAILDIEALRQYRTNSLFGSFLKDLRTEQYRMIYEQPIFPKNLCLHAPPARHARACEILREQVERLVERGVYKRPSTAKPEKVTEPAVAK